MKTTFFFLFLLCFSMLTACDEERVPAAEAVARRTVLVYLAGDNSLTDEVWEKVDALVAGWRNEQDNLLIYQDTRGERGTPSLMKVVCEGGRSHTEVVKEYPDANSADPQLFSDVLRDALGRFPAPSCGLLLFSHGTGWLPEGSYSNPAYYNQQEVDFRSITDDAGREMEIAGFASAIPDGQFDFIVFEACLMAGVEVACELRGKSDYLVASSAEILSPGFTPVYARLLDCLFQEKPDLEGVAAAYIDYCNNREGVYRSGTISVIDLRRMDKLIQVASPLLQKATEAEMGTDLSALQYFDRTGNKLFFDFGDYMEQLIREQSPEADKAGLERQLKEVLQEVVPYKAATPFFVGLPVRRHSGLTIYAEQKSYDGLNEAYRQLSWYRSTRMK